MERIETEWVVWSARSSKMTSELTPVMPAAQLPKAWLCLPFSTQRDVDPMSRKVCTPTFGPLVGGVTEMVERDAVDLVVPERDVGDLGPREGNDDRQEDHRALMRLRTHRGRRGFRRLRPFFVADGRNLWIGLGAFACNIDHGASD